MQRRRHPREQTHALSLGGWRMEDARLRAPVKWGTPKHLHAWHLGSRSASKSSSSSNSDTSLPRICSTSCGQQMRLGAWWGGGVGWMVGRWVDAAQQRQRQPTARGGGGMDIIIRALCGGNRARAAVRQSAMRKEEMKKGAPRRHHHAMHTTTPYKAKSCQKGERKVPPVGERGIDSDGQGRGCTGVAQHGTGTSVWCRR